MISAIYAVEARQITEILHYSCMAVVFSPQEHHHQLEKTIEAHRKTHTQIYFQSTRTKIDHS